MRGANDYHRDDHRRTPLTTAPDPTAIEEALLRIQVVADIINTLGQALRGQHERHGNTLILMCGDLEEAKKTIGPVVQHLIDNSGRAPA